MEWVRTKRQQMELFELSKRLYEKEKRMYGNSLFLRDDYGKRGYRYWCVKNYNKDAVGFMITENNVIIALEIKQKRKGYGKGLVNFCKQKTKMNFIVEYPTENSILFYRKMNIQLTNW
jgi:hypothetical protein